VLSSLLIDLRLWGYSPNCRLAWIRTNCSIYVCQKNQRKDGNGGRENPGCLVITGSPTQKPSPAVQALPSYLCELVAVIQVSYVDPILLQQPPLHLACPFSLRGLPLLLAQDAASIGPYTAAPSELVQIPDCWVNDMITAL
jgi:hypothetical protein